jgi:quinoprotein dehydrogenase-associated probable ABC transporter substrate-binding protein
MDVRRRSGLLALFAMSLMSPGPAPAATGNYADLVNREVLRVCAIPTDLPYSNDKGEGFDNKIAELIAADLKVPVTYTWYPGGYGLIKNTLAAKRCDMVMGTIQEGESTLNTNPYYRSTYALIFRKGTGLDGLHSLSDPRLKGKRVSNQGGPVGNFIAANGLMQDAKSYLMNVDRRYLNPEKQIVDDVLSGEIDVGILWGPYAGYETRGLGDQLEVNPILEEHEGNAKLEYRISIGVRPTDSAWKRQLNDVLARHQTEIDKILLDYGVPLVDEQNQLIASPRTQAAAETH